VLAYLALVPSRLRTLVFLLPIASALWITAPRLVDLGSADTASALSASAASAVELVAVTAFGLFLAGAAMTLIDRFVVVPDRVTRIAARVVAVGGLALAFGGVVLVVGFLDPAERVRQGWRSFSDDTWEPSDNPRLLRGVQTNRGDLWRVAIDEFREHPVTGIGTENFGVEYLQYRRSDEETLYPHSLPLQILTQTGIVGALLFLAFLAAALTAAVLALARSRGLDRAVRAVAAVSFLYWFAHASIEWFWELPALTAPALALLALAGGRGAPPSREALWTRAASRGIAALLALACLSFGAPWLAARYTSYASGVWGTDVAAAAGALDRARRLNPLSDGPDLTAGAIARHRRDWRAMADAYSRAVERNPHSWYSRLQLALALAKGGRAPEARRQLAEAKLLNPREPLLDQVGGWLRTGEDVDVGAVEQELAERQRRLTR
jgi:hypothetical protein